MLSSPARSWPILTFKSRPPSSQAGKTSVLEALKAACDASAGSVAPAAIQPTVGLNIGSLDLAGSPVTVWDLGGAPGLRRIWTEYYGEAHAVVMVVDASTPSRFQESKHALDSALGEQVGARGVCNEVGPSLHEPCFPQAAKKHPFLLPS